MSRLTRTLIVIALSLLVSQSSLADAKLKVGDPAPPLAQGKYVKGEPVTKFEPGKMYVVEFWATWCGPCRQSIPHITEMSKKFKDIVFIGQDCWEDDESKVEPFVKEMGDKMGYRVALDDKNGSPKGKMAETWMDASGQGGIPCAFVVGKDSTIQWIGHPMEMEAVLTKIAAGTFDAKKEAAASDARNQVMEKLGEAMQKGDTDGALKILDEIAKSDPDLGRELTGARYSILMQKKDFKAAYAMGDQLVEAYNENPQVLNEIAWTVLDSPGIETRDYDFCMKLATKANELTDGKNAAILDTLARAYFEKGDAAKAVELETKAVELADETLKADLQAALKRYQEKAGK